MYAGAVPRRATIPSSIEAVASAVMLLAATIASASRVCSSTMLSSFRTRPSAVWSNWKSSAQTWFGRSARWGRQPRYLIRDRDRSYGGDFIYKARAIGIETVLTGARFVVRLPTVHAPARRG